MSSHVPLADAVGVGDTAVLDLVLAADAEAFDAEPLDAETLDAETLDAETLEAETDELDAVAAV